MRSWLSSSLIGAASASLISGAMAQPPESKPADVVVTGKRDHQDAAHRFVNEVTAEKNGQVAQFGELVCPLVLGLPSAYDKAIAQRFIKDAQDAGVGVRGPVCTPNVVIMIADDGQRLVDKLHTERPAMFEGMELQTLKALLADSGPVHAWQGLEFLDHGGTPVGIPGPPLVPVSGVVIDSYPNAHNFSPSRLDQAFRERIDSAFVVIDLKATAGLTVGQIADYAAMRALAMTRAPKSSSLGDASILTLFDKDGADPKPTSLSPGDAAYLHALYATSSEVSGAAQRSSMAQSVTRALSGAMEPSK